jgi:hypothetical protein
MPHAALYVSIWHITSAGQIGGEAMTSPSRSQRSLYIQQLCDFFHVVTDILVVALYYPHFLFGCNKLAHNGEYTLAKLGLVGMSIEDFLNLMRNGENDLAAIFITEGSVRLYTFKLEITIFLNGT